MRELAPPQPLDVSLAYADASTLLGTASRSLGTPREPSAGGQARTLEEPGLPARAPARERVEVGTVIGGRYRVRAFVAEGAFGAVYRAEDIDIAGHVVALKLMHRPSGSEEEHARCLREVQLIAAVSHPSVVSFKDHGLHRGRFFIVMPWYQGETLAERLSRAGGLSRVEARRIFTSLAEALAAMHERGIRHQDVKPENILLARLGEGQGDFPVLLDLGVGAFGHEQLAAFTAAYAAPEMARAYLGGGEEGRPVDGKADVFSLALTLFDALLPGARSVPERPEVRQTLERRAAQGADLPFAQSLADIRAPFARWLALDPRQRPSARELAQELSVLTRELERREERKRLWWRAGPILCAVLSVVLVLAFQLRKERVRSRSKDLRIEQQEIEIGQAREAIDALSGARRATLQDYIDLKQKNQQLAERLSHEQERAQQLELSLERERERTRDEQERTTAERVLLLESELAELEQRLAQNEEQRASAQRELSRARRQFDETLAAVKHEKSDLAALVRQLIKERDRLSERLSELSRSRGLLARRADALRRHP